MTLAADGKVDVSVLVPAADEADNLPEFVRQCADAFRTVPYACEVVVVNDGSLDDSATVLERLQAEHRFLRVAHHRSRRGIADALRTAGELARGDIFVFYPADLQFLPKEIPDLVEPIRLGKADIVTGTKQGDYEKAFVSGVYNRLCRLLFGVRVSDLNAVKAYRREVMGVVPARPDWHRFMVVIAAADGYSVAERAVTLHPRRAGTSKFGLGRIPVGVIDLLSVWFQLRFGRKPLLFFGLSGGILFLLGFLVGIVALVLRFGYGIGFRPLLDLVMVLVITGVALFGFGFLGEMLAGAREDVRALGRSLEELLAELKRKQ
ncbi:MAG: glycosyltransferase family 2 protein [Gemmatimonadota bacterium]|nr:glycosyltransferase family 2 protein [Gemmatimonadota bacterium]MDH3369021.1 glycosyltransferase family 2 protein [Gemmatimonadota bacterium]MDH3477139.1 glycosyltransferase family 2 protein [Gemmatimonadota bacterium]MDH3571232.1 glycosyltransferase family 2 protein [Gemmatimonadota bacterium]MDH5550474.1 glycosyltransferase family 2 protein [Gemmatimonadota bacterium]